MATPEIGGSRSDAPETIAQGAGRVRPHMPHNRTLIIFAVALVATLLVTGRYAGDIRTLLHPAAGYVVFGLDSLSFCDGSSHPGDLAAPYEATVMKALPGWRGWNASVPHQQIQEALDGANGDQSLVATLKRVPRHQQRWLVVTAGAEDLMSGQATVNKTEWRVLQLCSLAHDSGFKVAIHTLPAVGKESPFLRISYPLWEKSQKEFNDWLKTSGQKLVDAVVDSAADPRLADPTDTRYYSPDQFHLSNAGYEVLGETTANVLVELASPSASQPVTTTAAARS